MHLDLIQMISLAGKAHVPNDDRVGCAGRHAWVIDGATDLGEPGLLGDRCGSAWIAAEAHAAFTKASGSITEICRHVCQEVAAGYSRDRRRDPIAEWELPRASFAAVAIEGDTLHCAFIGDCIALHRGGGGVNFVTPAPDTEKERAQAAALGPGIGAQDLVSDVVLADRRAARLGLDGCLGIEPGKSHASIGYRQAAVARGDDLLLMSDGFSALVDAYGVYDAAGLIVAVRELGLASLAEDLRRIEREDAGCLRFPRFKVSDDASAILLRVG